MDIVSKTERFVQEYMRQFDCSHDWHHVERVVRQALVIAKAESANTSVDILVVHLAALLHDVNDAKYTKESTVSIAEFLTSNGLEEAKARLVSRIVDNVSFRKELKADGKKKLLKLCSMMKTKTGKQEAQHRHDFMVQFLAQVDSEYAFGNINKNSEAGPGRDSNSISDKDEIAHSNSDSYDGDHSDNSSDEDLPSDNNEWTPVVTFAEATKKSPGSSRLRLSVGRSTVHAGQRNFSTAELNQPQSAGIRGHRSRRKRFLDKHADQLGPTRSFPALSTLAKGSGPEMAPLNTPALDGMPDATSAQAGLHRHDASPHTVSAYVRETETPAGSAPNDQAAIPFNDIPFPLFSEESSSESATPPSSDSSPAIENLWLRRARTFSIQNQPEDLQPPRLEQSSGSTHTLPRVSTVMSGREKEDDLPPMRIGREITNDLRNIQLTFSNEPEDKRRSINPFKRLVRSKHNFRALVTYGGYLIPINILLNVILLGRGWLEYKEPNADGIRDTVINPIGYLITSVISLILIVISGLCFILRCLEFDVLLTTTISIVANFVNAALILASAIMYLKNERPLHPDARLTGEYYSSYAGAAVALLDALLLLLDILVTPGFRYRGSGMSRPQRMLQFNVIVVVVWIGIGGYVWSKIESWDTITSIMFCMVTITTIGFGNISPSKTYSRILQLIYGPLGILMFGLMLLNTRNVIIQITRSKFRTAKRDFAAKRKKIEQEMTAEHVKRRIAARPNSRSWHSVFTDMLGRLFLSRNQRGRIGVPRWSSNREDQQEAERDLETGQPDMIVNSPTYATDYPDPPAINEHQNISFAEQGASAPISDTANAHNEDADNQAPHPMNRTHTTASHATQETPKQPGKLQNIRRRLGISNRKASTEYASQGASDNGKGMSSNRSDVYESDTSDENTGLDVTQTTQTDAASPKPGRLEKVKSVASNMRDKMKRKPRKKGSHDIAKQLWAALIINVGFWLMSAGIFYACERHSQQWNYFDAMWFCYVAFTTIGYGDYVPISTEGMVAFICLCFVAVGLETFLVVSSVSFFTNVLSRALKRTRVQKRIAQHHKSLAAYEIRRHIKHPNYNPFSADHDEHMLKLGVRRIKRSWHHLGQLLRGKRSLGRTFTRHRTRDQREQDERLTQGFIQHTTGMGGFAATSWQPPSPHQSFVSEHPVERQATIPPPQTAPHTAMSMPPPNQLHNQSSNSVDRSASISSAPEDFLWAFF
ncbi:Potassium channel [Coemansia sp. RSA 2336]|nr:Potassium channel [Coemansia sp. RSA 2336]